ncbi:MAG: WD40 repeat domain-containing protein [Chloroflexi bacterium]|nr:WD40 repeat domain-containing protein [Chloroflexota bacterium]
MKNIKLAVGGLFVTTVLFSLFLSWRGLTSVAVSNEYRTQIYALETAQAKNDLEIKQLLALQLASQAHEINIQQNSDHVVGVLLAVQSMRILPTIEAAQVIQSNLHTWRFLPVQKNVDEDNVRIINAIALSPDGKYIASGRVDGTILIQELETGWEIIQIKLGGKKPSVDVAANSNVYWMSPGEENSVNSIAFSPDGKYIVSGSADNTVRIWDVANGQEILRMIPDYYTETRNGITYYISGVASVAFSPDGKYIASGGTDGSLYVWDVSSKKTLAKVSPLPKRDISPYTMYVVQSVIFSPDGQYVAMGNTDRVVRVWDMQTQREVVSIDSCESGAPLLSSENSIAFSPDSRYLAWGNGIEVCVWDIVVEQEVLIMQHDHTLYSIQQGQYSVEDAWTSSIGTVNSVTYSADGRYILSASDDNTARIWDAVTGQEISRIVHDVDRYTGSVRFAIFSTDGKYVISSDSLGQLNLWLWKPDDLIAEACAHIPRNLTREEWTKYTDDMILYQAICPNLPIE